MARPIFIVGKHRSGTTGLANHLSQNDNVSAVKHTSHYGVHESAYFTRVIDNYSDIGTREEFANFVDLMSRSDYFRLTGIRKAYMLSLYPTTLTGFFGQIMNEFARRQGAQFWLEKSPPHTKRALWLAEQYPEAQFIGIIRNVADVVASSLRLRSEELRKKGRYQRLIRIARIVNAWVYYNKAIQELKTRHSSRTLILRYEDFCGDKKVVLKNACSFLGVSFENDMMEVPYVHNSSFSGSKNRKEELTETERDRIRTFASVLEKIPYEMYRSLDALREYFRGRRDLPSWFIELSDEEIREHVKSR